MCRDYRFKEKIYIYYRVTQSRPIKLSFHCLRLYIAADAAQCDTTPPCVIKMNHTTPSYFLLKYKEKTQQINKSNYGATRGNCEKWGEKKQSAIDELCWFLLKSYCLQTSTNQKTVAEREDKRQQLKECRQECRKIKHWNVQNEGGKKIKFCIYTHDLIRIYTNVVVSNKQ